jgi:hypothetical protein
MGQVLFELERGLPYTARLMLRRPGTVARRYLDGEARRFMGPVGYFLLAATLLYLVFGALEDDLLRLARQYETEPATWTGLEASLADALGATTRDELMQRSFRFQQNYFTYLELLAALPVALGLRLLFPQRTVAEWMVVELYAKAQIMIYTSVLLPLLVTAGSRSVLVALGSLGGVIQLCVHVWAVCDFRDPSLPTAARAVGAYIWGSLAWVGAGAGLIVLFAAIL